MIRSQLATPFGLRFCESQISSKRAWHGRSPSWSWARGPGPETFCWRPRRARAIRAARACSWPSCVPLLSTAAVTQGLGRGRVCATKQSRPLSQLRATWCGPNGPGAARIAAGPSSSPILPGVVGPQIHGFSGARPSYSRPWARSTGLHRAWTRPRDLPARISPPSHGRRSLSSSVEATWPTLPGIWPGRPRPWRPCCWHAWLWRQAGSRRWARSCPNCANRTGPPNLRRWRCSRTGTRVSQPSLIPLLRIRSGPMWRDCGRDSRANRCWRRAC